MDLKGKITLVVGGSGLIGRSIVEHFRSKGSEVYNLDITDDADYKVIRDGNKVSYSIPNPLDIFINASYPISLTEHYCMFRDMTHYIAQYMSKKGGGCIINLASIYGVIGPKDSLYEKTKMNLDHEYCMVKGGIIALTRAIATRFGKDGIRANCVSPGGVFDNQNPKFVRRYCKRVPLGQMAKPEDVAHACVFLVENDYITGQNIIIDGGLTAW